MTDVTVNPEWVEEIAAHGRNPHDYKPFTSLSLVTGRNGKIIVVEGAMPSAIAWTGTAAYDHPFQAIFDLMARIYPLTTDELEAGRKLVADLLAAIPPDSDESTTP